MTAYFLLKVIHIVSAAVLFGTGLGTAYFKWMVDRSGNVAAIRVVADKVVLADWIFTTPAIVIQPITGLLLAYQAGTPLDHGWLFHALCLYVLAGACWIPVVYLQIVMRNLARIADGAGALLDARYWRLARYWFWLGVPAFTSVLVVFWLMVRKP